MTAFVSAVLSFSDVARMEIRVPVFVFFDVIFIVPPFTLRERFLCDDVPGAEFDLPV